MLTRAMHVGDDPPAEATRPRFMRCFVSLDFTFHWKALTNTNAQYFKENVKQNAI